MRTERVMGTDVKQEHLEDERINVLLIEDESDFARLVQKKLHKSTKARFKVEWADSLSKGLQLFASKDIDLVILDLNLPDSREIDTFVRMRECAPDIPIVILTADEDETVAMKLIQMGAEAYLNKKETMNLNLGRHILHSYRRFKMQSQRHSDISNARREANFRNVLDNNADGIVITNQDGFVLYVNSAAEFLFGRNEKDMVGSHFGFPLVTGDKTEVNIIHRSGVNLVMEMHMVVVDWLGESAYLASLRDVTDRKKNEEALYNLSITDDLTGLHNRRGFFSLAERHLNMVGQVNRGFLVVFIDLDGLKEINDTLGHPMGSQALIDTAELLRDTFRDSDIMARFGGDEFVILAKDASEDFADLISRRLQKNTESFNKKERRPYALSMSAGVAHYDPLKPATIEELVNSADRSMYVEKQKKQARRSRYLPSG